MPRLLPVSSSHSFLVIDFHPESRFLLVKTLVRKFPGATIHETDDADEAMQIARKRNLTAIVTHRTFDVPGADLVRRLRGADSEVPIVMVSGIDRAEAALAAGATAFLHYDEWLRLGSLVAAQLARRAIASEAQR